MFFNKLREELKEYLKDCLKERLVIFAEKYTKDIIEGIQINNKSIEELIEKYKHTKWEELTPFEKDVLIDRFNLPPLVGYLGVNKRQEIILANWHYVGDTLTKVKERQEKRTALKKEVKKSFSEKYLPPMFADIYGNTMVFEDFRAIKKIKDILETEKSTVKAIKEIKEILKDVE